MHLFSRIGKENFELRKKLFEHGDDSSLAGENLSYRIDRRTRLVSIHSRAHFQLSRGRK